MVVVAEVDCFLKKDDLLWSGDEQWPWKITHFILFQTCIGCGYLVSPLIFQPKHFIISDKTIKKLHKTDFFWC